MNKIMLMLATLFALAIPAAAAIDLSDTVTDLTTQVNGATSSGLTIGALAFGAILVWAIFRRIAAGR